MRSLSRFLCLVVALVWVPLTAHCRLASVPGLEFLRCADREHSEHGDNKSCEDRGCCVQESGKYQTSRWEERITEVRPGFAAPLQAEVPAIGLPAEESGGILTAAPPPPPQSPSWVFVLRLALPVRAPSSAS